MSDRDPFVRFDRELERARPTERFDPTRAALATATRDGRPSVRFVLVKGADPSGFVFFTNTTSRKAAEIAENPYAALAWHWESTGVQVRAEGSVSEVTAQQADAYFATRPRGSQIAAWASPQSSAIPDRAWLERRFAEEEQRFLGVAIPRPPFWIGYRLKPESIEFWFAQDNRLHHRERGEKELSRGEWKWTVIAP